MRKEGFLLKNIKYMSKKQKYLFTKHELQHYLEAIHYVISTAEVMQGSMKYAE
jgi:hypothetical protein